MTVNTARPHTECPLTKKPSPCRFPSALAALLMAAALSAPAAAQQQKDASAQQPVLASIEADQINRLAQTGRFDELLRRLDAEYGQVAPDTRTAALMRDLRRQRANAEAYRAQQAEAFKAKLEEMAKALADDDLDEALVLAIEAHGLSDQPQVLFAKPVLIEVVAAAKARAEAAEKRHDWVESSSIYRLLNLLYEEQDGFADDLDRVSLHIQMLALYAPDVLDELYDARDQRLGREDRDGEGNEVEREDWSTRLKGVERKMLFEALRWSASRHVDRGGYEPMLMGAFDRLRILTQTQGLEKAFPAMADADTLQAFRDHLDRASVALQDPATEADRIYAESAIDALLGINEATIKLPERVVIYELGEGAMGTLDDFSSIIWPSELETFSRSTQGAFFGVGIQISRRDGRLVVVSPLENTPAQRAGIKSGDIIALVDGKPTDSWTLNRAVNQITGPEGSDVTLGVERGAQQLEFVLKRARIEIESIRGWEHRPASDGGGWDYWLDRDAGIGYVRLSQFIPQTAGDLDTAVAQMQADRAVRGLILDLRFNPGGRLDSSIDVADRFIAEGPIVSTVDGDGDKTNTERARRFRTYEDFPVVVLVNQGSASASEIVAGALQDYGRAMIVGSRSFGKGSVQDLFELANHRARLKLTRQYYMLPLGRIIHRKKGAKQWGIQPDLAVNMTTDQVAESLRIRQEADILRDGPAEAASPAQGDAEAQAEAPAAPVQPNDILDRGVDPQLEAALIVLKAQQLADQLADAEQDEPQARLDGK